MTIVRIKTIIRECDDRNVVTRIEDLKTYDLEKYQIALVTTINDMLGDLYADAASDTIVETVIPIPAGTDPEIADFVFTYLTTIPCNPESAAVLLPNAFITRVKQHLGLDRHLVEYTKFLNKCLILANTWDIKHLVESICVYIADTHLKQKTPQQILASFNLPVDHTFSQAEVDAVCIKFPFLTKESLAAYTQPANA